MKHIYMILLLAPIFIVVTVGLDAASDPKASCNNENPKTQNEEHIDDYPHYSKYVNNLLECIHIANMKFYDATSKEIEDADRVLTSLYDDKRDCVNNYIEEEESVVAEMFELDEEARVLAKIHNLRSIKLNRKLIDLRYKKDPVADIIKDLSENSEI